MSINSLRRKKPANRWIVPATCVAFAVVLLVIGVVRHDMWLTIASPLIMIGYGAFLLLFARRSEAVSLLAGDESDERRTALQLKARAATAQILVLVLVGGFIWSLSTGSHHAQTFSWLCAVGGISYIGSLVWYSRRG